MEEKTNPAQAAIYRYVLYLSRLKFIDTNGYQIKWRL